MPNLGDIIVTAMGGGLTALVIYIANTFIKGVNKVNSTAQLRADIERNVIRIADLRAEFKEEIKELKSELRDLRIHKQ